MTITPVASFTVKTKAGRDVTDIARTVFPTLAAPDAPVAYDDETRSLGCVYNVDEFYVATTRDPMPLVDAYIDDRNAAGDSLTADFSYYASMVVIGGHVDSKPSVTWITDDGDNRFEFGSLLDQLEMTVEWTTGPIPAPNPAHVYETLLRRMNATTAKRVVLDLAIFLGAHEVWPSAADFMEQVADETNQITLMAGALPVGSSDDDALALWRMLADYRDIEHDGPEDDDEDETDGE